MPTCPAERRQRARGRRSVPTRRRLADFFLVLTYRCAPVTRSRSASAKSIITTSVSDSADLWECHAHEHLPAYLQPQLVVTSTSGNVLPIDSTSLNLLLRGIGVVPDRNARWAELAARGGINHRRSRAIHRSEDGCRPSCTDRTRRSPQTSSRSGPQLACSLTIDSIGRS